MNRQGRSGGQATKRPGNCPKTDGSMTITEDDGLVIGVEFSTDEVRLIQDCLREFLDMPLNLGESDWNVRIGWPREHAQELQAQLQVIHSTVSFTLDVYTHAIPQMQEAAADQVAELIFGTNNGEDTADDEDRSA